MDIEQQVSEQGSKKQYVMCFKSIFSAPFSFEVRRGVIEADSDNLALQEAETWWRKNRLQLPIEILVFTPTYYLFEKRKIKDRWDYRQIHPSLQ